MKLKNRTAIITGAARGIGRAVPNVLRLKAPTSSSPTCWTILARRRPIGWVPPYKHCDVSKSSDVKAAVAAVVKQHGAVDILLNNAAINISGDFLEISEADYDKVLDINLKGSFLMLQACAREMVKQGAGSIINMSSVNDTLAIPSIVSYCVAKGGVSQLTRATSISLAPHGIRVNAIGPGSIMTDMLKSVVNDKVAMARVMSRTPMGRVGQPSEIASIAVFLASDEVKLCHRPDHLRRRRPHAIELYDACEGMIGSSR